MNSCRSILPLLLVITLCSCNAPDPRLTFPTSSMATSGDLTFAVSTNPQKHPLTHLAFAALPVQGSGSDLTWYDANHNGKPGFAVSTNSDARSFEIYYSNNEDGKPDRSYRPSDYADRDVPHVILLLDSIPYQSIVDFYNAGHLRFFNPPLKVIAPFPSLTEICYSDVLHAPPLPGMIDQSYDPDTRRQRSALWARIYGYSQPWERRLDYHAKFWEYAMSFLEPRPWYSAELERCRKTVDDSPNNITLVYAGSASSMVCKYGKAGIDETLEQAEQLCLQLLYERHGAIKISMMADHGHNMLHSTNIPLDEYMKSAGFHPGPTLGNQTDVVLEINGLVTYAAVQTTQPQKVAIALVQHPHIQLVMYPEGDRIIVRNRYLLGAIECKDQQLRYDPIAGDVLGYGDLMQSLKRSGKMNTDGFMSDADWFTATADNYWPDAPRRIWDAFHRIAVNPPQVMFTVEDGYCAGLKEYEKYIDMASTHGGLNQLNSASFVMTMKNINPSGPMRSRDVLQLIQPGFDPPVHPW